jgi:ABC-type uncharacterized transport system substrate-binding protein
VRERYGVEPAQIVFAQVTDPVGAGLVESLARPGGNATGFALAEYSTSGKWMELLKEVAPSVTRVAVLRDQASQTGLGQFAAIQVQPLMAAGLSTYRRRCRVASTETGCDPLGL